MRIRKYHPHNAVLFVTCSIEEGLLFQSNPLINLIIKSCLARAQRNHPVKISALVMEANHIHLLLVVVSPESVAGFMRCFKTETAHMINIILGRRKRTVWCEGYDSPIVLTPIRALLVMTYIYSNPSKDNLVDSIDQYPGVSTWRMFLEGQSREVCPYIRRTMIREMSLGEQNLKGYKTEAIRLVGLHEETHDLKIEPNAWMEAFGIGDKGKQETLNQVIIRRVRTLEERSRRKRMRLGYRVLGTNRMIDASIDMTYRSRRDGKKMQCLSEKRSTRVQFLFEFRLVTEQAERVRSLWKLGDFSQKYPPGLYPPLFPKLCEPTTTWPGGKNFPTLLRGNGWIDKLKMEYHVT